MQINVISNPKTCDSSIPRMHSSKDENSFAVIEKNLNILSCSSCQKELEKVNATVFKCQLHIEENKLLLYYKPITQQNEIKEINIRKSNILKLVNENPSISNKLNFLDVSLDFFRNW